MPDTDIAALLPRDKHDIENVEKLIALGYPAVAPGIPRLLEWLQDMNWPVAQALRPFLANIGLPLAGDIRVILKGDDLVWTFWILDTLVAPCEDLTAALRPEIEKLASIDPIDDDASAARDLARRLIG